MTIKDQIPVDRKEWYAVRCKYRCEKRLMIHFTEQDIEAYVPILHKVKQYATRRKTSSSVLIASHIFVRIDRSSYLPVLQHHHVFGFLNFSGIICAIPEIEMTIMKKVVGASDVILTSASEYSIGDQVEIIRGEMTGIRGHLIEETNHNFKIELLSLGMGLKINIDPKYLTKIASRRKVA